MRELRPGEGRATPKITHQTWPYGLVQDVLPAPLPREDPPNQPWSPPVVGKPQASWRGGSRDPPHPQRPPGLARFPDDQESGCLSPSPAASGHVGPVTLGPRGAAFPPGQCGSQLPRDGGRERGRVCARHRSGLGARCPWSPAAASAPDPAPRPPAHAPQRPPAFRPPTPSREDPHGLWRPRRRPPSGPPAGCSGAAGAEPPSSQWQPLARRRAPRSSPGHPETGEAGPAPNTMPGRPAAAKRSPSQPHRLRAARPEVARRGLGRSRPLRPRLQRAL